ncbi:hypothetical protein DUI87_00338 [Hirundo rustica rustica]|uniref:G-protein coupled receptors family 1 profile domain-containing protein n=1 Tax=Hirundo rustica rustica TaxID=333673 RepID=A0A3M0LAN1_HIRRU|nr:hypothetical protein DUI87_00338 [Hirundo rustica rustica]
MAAPPTSFYPWDDAWNLTWNDTWGDLYEEPGAGAVPPGHRAVLALYAAVFLLGVAGNGAVLWVTAAELRRTVNGVWFSHLALADLLSWPGAALRGAAAGHRPPLALGRRGLQAAALAHRAGHVRRRAGADGHQRRPLRAGHAARVVPQPPHARAGLRRLRRRLGAGRAADRALLRLPRRAPRPLLGQGHLRHVLRRGAAANGRGAELATAAARGSSAASWCLSPSSRAATGAC